MDDIINVQVKADFSTFEQSFKAFSNSLSTYNDIPGMKAQVDGLIASFSKLSEVTSNLDKNLGTTSGIKEAQKALKDFNNQSSTMTGAINKLQERWQSTSKVGLMPTSQLEKFVDPVKLDGALKSLSASELSKKRSELSNGFKAPLNIGYDLASQKAELRDGYARLAIAKEMGIQNIPIRVSSQSFTDKSGYPVVGSNATASNQHGDFDPKEVFGTTLPTTQKELIAMNEVISKITDSYTKMYDAVKLSESSSKVTPKSMPKPRSTTKTPLTESARKTIPKETSDSEFDDMLSELEKELGIDPKIITGKKQRTTRIPRNTEVPIADKFDVDESSLEQEFGTSKEGENASKISTMPKDVQALYKKMKGKGRIQGYNDDIWDSELSKEMKRRSESPNETFDKSIKETVQSSVDKILGIEKKATVPKQVEKVQNESIQKKQKQQAEIDSEKNRILQEKLDAINIKSAISNSSTELSPQQRAAITRKKNKDAKMALEHSIDNPVVPQIVVPVVPKLENKPIELNENTSKAKSALVNEQIVRDKNVENSKKKIDSDELLRNQKIEESKKRTEKIATEKTPRNPRVPNSGNGLINKTPEQLEKELALITSENEMVNNLLNGFKELVSVIKAKNILLVEEGKLVKDEVSDVNQMNKTPKTSKKSTPTETTIPSSNNEMFTDSEFEEFDTSQLKEADELLGEGNDELSAQQKKLESINNYLTNLEIKIGNLRKTYGNLIDTPAISGPLEVLRQNIEAQKTSPNKTFNRSNPSTEYNSIVNDVKTTAGQLGITNPTAMYGKLVALIKEEANLKVSMGKTDGAENEVLNQKQLLVADQITSLKGILDQYNLLTDVQKESLSIEQQKADLTVKQGEAKQTGNSENEISENLPNVQENLVKPTNQFFDAFGNKEGGVINSLKRIQSSVMNVRFALQGLMMMAGGKEVYNFLIGTNAQIQVLESSLSVTLKSAEKASTMVQQLRSYAADTPFQELETFKSGEMLASNKMDVMSSLKSAGDLAAAKTTQGTTLEDVVNVMTRINSGDFGKAMIRLRQMGISLADFRTQGLKFSKNNTYEGTSSQMLTALDKIIDTRYGGLTQTLAGTVNGSISTIKDYFQQLGIDLGGGIFGQFQTSLTKWKRELHDFRNSSEFKQIIVNFNKTFNTLKDFVTPIGPILLVAFNGILAILPQIASYFKIFASVKIGQGLLEMYTTLKGNLAKVLEQQALQKSLIQGNNEQEIFGNTILDKAKDKLSQILAMRKLGLQAATDTAAADAMAASTLESRGVGFASNYKNSGSTISTEEDIIAAGGVSEARLNRYNTERASGVISSGARTEAELAAAGSLEGVGTSALEGGGAAVMSGLLSSALLIIPILLGISAITKGIFGQNEAKFSSDDYKRMASEKMGTVDTLNNLNIERMSARAQIDAYNATQQTSKDELANAKSELSADPNNKAKQDALQSAQYNLAKTSNQLSVSNQQLQTTTQQLIDLEPDLGRVLIDNNGAITDSTAMFDRNTKAIEATIKARELEISRDKENALATATNESKKAQLAIDRNNEAINLGNGASSGMGMRIFAGVESALAGGVNSFLGMFGQHSSKLDLLKSSMGIAQKDSLGRDIAVQDTVTANVEEQKKIANQKMMQSDKDTAIKNGFFEDQILPDGSKERVVLWNKWEAFKTKNSKSDSQFLLDQDGAATRAEEISSGGSTKLDQVKNKYQVKLNASVKAHNGSTNTDEYRAIQAQRDEEIETVSKEFENSMDSLAILNKTTREEVLKRAKNTIIGPVADILSSDDNLKLSDIQNALKLISDGQADMITGVALKYKAQLIKFFNVDLKGNLSNMDVANLELTDIEQTDNNRESISDAQAKLAIQKSNDLKDRTSDEYSNFSKQSDNKLSEAMTQKEIALQQQEAIGNAKGTEMYDKSMKDSDATLKGIIATNIAGFKRLLDSGKLSEDDQWAAKSKIAELQKQANDLTGEINETLNKDRLTLFHDKNDGALAIAQGKKDLLLQADELQNYTPDSTKYLADSKTAGLGIRDLLLNSISELNGIIENAHGLDKITAITTQIDLQKQANQIMLDIKKNTNKFGEFNAPGFVKTMTYYDYMTKDSNSKSVEIANASFVFQVDAIQSEADIDNMYSLVNEKIGVLTQTNDRAGRSNYSASGKG